MSMVLDLQLSPRKGGLTFIEQLHALSIELCPNPSVPYLIGIKDKKAVLVRGMCGLWSCPICGASNGRKWLARLLNHINTVGRSKKWYFLTITAHEKWRGATASRTNIQQGWKKLYNRMRRKYGTNDYIKVWEFHKDGSFHLHVLINHKVGKKWLKDNSRSCGMGYQCDSTKAKNGGQIAGYVSKYLIKSFVYSDKYVKGMRRIEASRSWTKLPEMMSDMDEWRVTHSRSGQKHAAEKLKHDGFKIVDKVPLDHVIDGMVRGYMPLKKQNTV